MIKPTIKTFGELKESGYQQKTIKEELRTNLIGALQEDRDIFPGIIGYDHSVIPQIERAILAGHSINFLGLRGQAKTKMSEKIEQIEKNQEIIKSIVN